MWPRWGNEHQELGEVLRWSSENRNKKQWRKEGSVPQMTINVSPSQNPHPLSHQWTGPRGSSLPPNAQPIGTGVSWGRESYREGQASPGHCHLTYCDSVIAQEALHAASAILDNQGLAQVLEGEGLGWVKAVMVLCNKDPDQWILGVILPSTFPGRVETLTRPCKNRAICVSAILSG